MLTEHWEINNALWFISYIITNSGITVIFSIPRALESCEHVTVAATLKVCVCWGGGERNAVQ